MSLRPGCLLCLFVFTSAVLWVNVLEPLMWLFFFFFYFSFLFFFMLIIVFFGHLYMYSGWWSADVCVGCVQIQCYLILSKNKHKQIFKR